MRRGTFLTLSAAMLAMAGCAAAPEPSDTPPVTPPSDLMLAQLQRTLPGPYSNFAQVHEGGAPAPVIDLRIARPPDGTVGLFRLTQTPRDSQARQFEYEFSPEAGGEALSVVVRPVTADGRVGEAPEGCALLLRPIGATFAGQTDPAQCRLAHPEHGEVGLLRELAIESDALSVGERLLDADGASLGADRILTFRRVTTFDGWAGLRVGDGEHDWRLATPFTLQDDGRIVWLEDAAGDALGIGLQLATVRWRTDRPEILRLAVHDATEDGVRSTAWAAADSGQVGIQLEAFQAGLTRRPEP
ncbi:MAG: hypothetical protein R3233_11835 [Xanthomonadales bacterium]|nr:hypothetical protein [Xanthomonadales bacterium]